MKQFRILIFFFLAISCEKPLTETNPQYHIILIMGQSNTLAGRWLDPAVDLESNGIMQLGRFYENDMAIIEAVEPLQHHSTYGTKRIGFGLSFAKHLNNYWLGEKDILIIPCGAGGTGFSTHYWNKGDTLYEDAVYRTNYVLSNYKMSKLTAILWHQGEEDVGEPNFQAYLDSFIVNIRCDLRADTVPFILGGMFPAWVNEKETRVVQQKILEDTKNRHKFVGYADPTAPFIIENNLDDESIHYDAEGQRELGKRYFWEYLKLIR